MTSSPNTPYSARASIVAAMRAHEVALKERAATEQQAKAAREAAIRQASASRDQGIKAAEARAAAERSRVDRLLADIDRHLADAESVLRQFQLAAPRSVPTPPPRSTDLSLEHAEFVTAYNDLGASFQELARVRGTLFVRLTRKIGLPPI